MTAMAYEKDGRTPGGKKERAGRATTAAAEAKGEKTRRLVFHQNGARSPIRA
jgi:hypothetical protein